MEIITLIGLGGAFLTTVAFVPQVIKSFTTKHTEDLSLGWICCLILGITLWLIYGAIIMDIPLIFANTFSFLLALSLLIMKLKWGMGK